MNGRVKTVEDYLAAPDTLAEFEHDIDAAAGTKGWAFLDEAALEELALAGWSASSEEGALLLRQGIGRDDGGSSPSCSAQEQIRRDHSYVGS